MAGYDGSITIDSSISSAGFNKGIKAIEGSLKGIASAIGATFSVAAIVAFGKQAVNTASEMQAAWTGLGSIIRGQGRDFAAAQKFIESYIADGLVPMTDAITTYKNLAARGYSDNQIQGIMTSLKDASAFGRQSSYTMGEAVRSASEGLKNENSILVDNAGVTKNVAKMWEDYARSIGTTSAKLTLAQKREAEYLGILQETRYQMGDAAKVADTYAGKIAALSTSWKEFSKGIGEGLITAFSALLPTIKTVIDFLAKGATAFSQLMSLYFGMKIPVSDTSNGLGKAADAAGSLADNTEKAGKAAKGALSAFDELNVLQQEDNPAPTTTGPTGNGGVVDKQQYIQIPGFFQIVWDQIRQGWDALWKSIQDGTIWTNIWSGMVKIATDAWNSIKMLWAIFAAWFKAAVIDPVVNWFKQAWENIKQAAGTAWSVVQIIWAKVGEWFRVNVIEPVKNFFKTLWEGIKSTAAGAWESIKMAAGNAWQSLVNIWLGIGKWFTTNVTDPVKNAFKGALDWVKAKWETTFDGVKNFVKGTVNSIIGFMNGMIRAIADGINSVIGGLNQLKIGPAPEWVAKLFGIPANTTWGFNIPPVSAPQIPYLATGAVVPAHANMLAMIGEGSQREIVSPEETMRRIVREEMGSQQIEVAVKFEGTMAQLARALNPAIRAENRRTGKSLILGAS